MTQLHAGLKNPNFLQKLNFSTPSFVCCIIFIVNIYGRKKMTDVKIRPLSDRLVIKVIEDTEQTSGGIFIPDSAKEKSQKGEVVSVGPGTLDKEGKRTEMEVKVGNKILFAKYSGTDVKFNNQEFKILSEKDVLAIID
jgi:chaperonin GroES